MRTLSLTGLTVAASLAIAACGGGASPPASPVPVSEAPASGAPASAEPASPEPAEASAACERTDAAAAVTVSIKGFRLPDIAAAVGQSIALTNEDPSPHTATLDDGSCSSGSIARGGAQALVFHAAGTYPYHCEFHKGMRGTITISG